MWTIRAAFSDSSRDVAMATDFMAKFGYMRSFGETAFKNGLQYRHSDSKIINGSMQYNSYTLCNPRDYESNKCTFLDKTEKIGLSHRLSHQLLDRPSPTFQLWGDYKTYISFAVVQGTYYGTQLIWGASADVKYDHLHSLLPRSE